MNPIARRDFLRQSALAAGLATAGRGLASGAGAAKPSRIRVGQIGTAHAHAAGKMEALRRLVDDFEVLGVVEPDAVRRRAAENSPVYRGLTWMGEEQLLHAPGLKVVAVETEVSQLLPTARRCAAAGMHMHLDKPAGENLAEYRQLLDQATSRQLCVQMGYMFRCNPAFRFCFEAVRQGWLGRIFDVYGLMSKMADEDERKRNLRYRGGVMFELGCHLIDPLVTVLGRPTAVTSKRRSLRPEQDGLADNAWAQFEYPSAAATIRVSLTEVEGGPHRQFVVCGTEGTLEIRPLEPPRLSLTLDRPRGQWVRGCQEVSLPKMPGRYDDQLRQLAHRPGRGAIGVRAGPRPAGARADAAGQWAGSGVRAAVGSLGDPAPAPSFPQQNADSHASSIPRDRATLVVGEGCRASRRHLPGRCRIGCRGGRPDPCCNRRGGSRPFHRRLARLRRDLDDRREILVAGPRGRAGPAGSCTRMAEDHDGAYALGRVLTLGWVWSFWFPVIKPLSTSSFVLSAAGRSFLLLALFYGVLDVLGWRFWAVPLVVLGANALLAYVLSHLFMTQICQMSMVLAGGFCAC